ncbi:Ferric enterobactin transport system permease protein FepD [Corynebacterium ciconiae DSM 44920]|uniref:FecCD family ABC transporter permease n=1 Tax=Corynebacterium ciconiae TaxID=227319 RepID=UPI0003640E91|nr:iron ABC transporter permease [Corynebacterium ciconiae]WKD61955.1 Ferric enterobactin transport system permease protein FepD [Corynebacterium ciconiae DSM 44920]
MSLHRRRLYGLLLLIIIVVLGVLSSLLLGARDIPLGTAVRALPHIGDDHIVDRDIHVIAHLRYPRTLLALLVGAALGVAGALIQGHTRNPLADPSLLGISSGAALAVVTGFSFFGLSSITSTSLLAFGGAIASTIVVFGLATSGKGRMNPLTLILSGAALSAVLYSFTSALVLTDEQNLNLMRFWTVGSVAGRDLSVFYGVLPLVLLGVIAALATGPTLNVLNLGEDAAAALGINTYRARICGMLLISLLAGAATAAAGPIGFLGLVVPHIARALTGPDYRWLLPYSALAGAALLLVADVVGRLIVRPGELQVGIVLAFVGAPFFLMLMYRKRVNAL